LGINGRGKGDHLSRRPLVIVIQAFGDRDPKSGLMSS
jgi:hypothetical protein